MSARKTRLVDCNPHWVSNYHGTDVVDAVRFDCPEGHADCIHVIPFTPALDGSSPTREHAQWQRTGDTFETLTLSPSIRRIQRHADRAAALAAGCVDEFITDSLFCALHIFIRNGQIEFCGDSTMSTVIDFFPFDDNTDHPGFRQALATHGITYAYIRASFSVAEDNYGTAVHVERADEMMRKIEDAGLTAGAYMMPDYRPGAAPAKAQVHAYLEAAKLRPGRLPPIVDIEGAALHDRARVAPFIAELFAELDLALPGVAKIAYCSRRVTDTDDADTLAGAANATLARCDFFVARYPFASHADAATAIKLEAGAAAPPVPHAGGDDDNWYDHQFAGDAIRIAGLPGQSDLNRWNLLSGATPMGVRRERALARLKSALGADARGTLDHDLRAYQDKRGLVVDGWGGVSTYSWLGWEPIAP